MDFRPLHHLVTPVTRLYLVFVRPFGGETPVELQPLSFGACRTPVDFQPLTSRDSCHTSFSSLWHAELRCHLEVNSRVTVESHPLRLATLARGIALP